MTSCAIENLQNALEAFPRVNVAHTPTPLDPADQLGRRLGLALHFKRDDAKTAGRLAGDRIIFLHTGGQPGLFAYGEAILDEVTPQ